jgi:Kef-type K+ transport system membrane component KefB
MTVFAILLVSAALAHALARLLRVPVIPVLLASGMLLSLGHWLESTSELGGVAGGFPAQRILEFGLAFLVFTSGVELNPRRFTRQLSAVLWTAFLHFTLSAAIGLGVAMMLGHPWLTGLYIAFGLSASSTLVVLRQLGKRRAMFEPFGRIVTGVLLLQDVAFVFLIVIMSRLPGGVAGVAAGLGATLVLGGVAWVCQRRVLPWLLRHFNPDEEALLLWLFAVLSIFLGAGALVGLPLVAAAFFAGFIFSAFPLNGLVRGQLSSLSQVFLAIFFVALGWRVGVPDATVFFQALELSLVVIVVTPPLVAAVAEWRGMTARGSIEAGLLLAQTSEYSLVLAISGLALNHISFEVFSVITLTTVMTMALTPFLGTERVANALLPLHPLRRRREVNPPRDHVLVLGFGSAGMWLVKPLRAAGHQIIVVDDDAVVHAALTKMGIHCIRGDGSDPATLDRAGAGHARVILATMRRVSDALKVLNHVKHIPVIVRVAERDEEHRVAALGGIPVLSAQNAVDAFMQWFATNERIPAREAARNLPRRLDSDADPPSNTVTGGL